MRIRDVTWPTGIGEKVESKHGLSVDEVETAVLDERAYIRRAGRDRYIVLGRALEGAYIATVVAHASGVARVISARAMTQSERRAYLRRGK